MLLYGVRAMDRIGVKTPSAHRKQSVYRQTIGYRSLRLAARILVVTFAGCQSIRPSAVDDTTSQLAILIPLSKIASDAIESAEVLVTAADILSIKAWAVAG